jgi:hypothetical protein
MKPDPSNPTPIISTPPSSVATVLIPFNRIPHKTKMGNKKYNLSQLVLRGIVASTIAGLRLKEPAWEQF